MAQPLIVRPEVPADIAAIRHAVSAAFGGAAEAGLVERLRAEGDGVLSLVALVGPALVGHVFLSRMRAPFRALALAPVSVQPQSQRAGVGSLLIRAALRRARDDGWQAAFVLGDPAYYRRFGFDPAAAAGFVSPYAGPHLMAAVLLPPVPTTTGRVCHATAFAALG